MGPFWKPIKTCTLYIINSSNGPSYKKSMTDFFKVHGVINIITIHSSQKADSVHKIKLKFIMRIIVR